jgi:Zn-dependent protease
VANAFGDPTARDLGRLSPNPIRHVDPIGTVVLPLVLAVSGAPVFGWAKPVPVVAQRMRNPRVHMILVALAGPGMNLMLAMLAGIVLALVRPDGPPSGPGELFLLLNLFNFIAINLFLAIFNLLPIPPFDGGHVVEGLLPRRLARHYSKLARFGFPLLIFLLLILPMLVPQANIVERVVRPPVEWLLRLFIGG